MTLQPGSAAPERCLYWLHWPHCEKRNFSRNYFTTGRMTILR